MSNVYALCSIRMCLLFSSLVRIVSSSTRTSTGSRHTIHVERDSAVAKFWLSPVALARSRGFPAQELTKLSRLVVEHRDQFQERWNEYFGN